VPDPAVVAGVVHEALAPAPVALRPRAHGRAEDLVPVAKDRRRHLEALTLRPLHRVAAAVEHRLDPLDLDPARRFVRSWKGHASALSPVGCER
jgi:hypothetical protein